MKTNASEGGTLFEVVNGHADFALHDAFPPAIRRALCESTIKWTAASVVNALSGRGLTVKEAVARIRAFEAIEMKQYSAMHEAAHGYPLPHLAAEVSIQRSGRQ